MSTFHLAGREAPRRSIVEGNSSAVVVVEGSGVVVGIVVGLAGVPYIVAELSTVQKWRGKGRKNARGKRTIGEGRDDSLNREEQSN